jgi:hypothetical protein
VLNNRLKLAPLWVFAVVVMAALAFLLTWAPEFMAKVRDPEMMSMDPALSNFIASGGHAG